MNFNIRVECEFLFHNFCCALPKDTVDVEVTIRTVECIHTYRRDRTTQAVSYSPWSRQVKPFPSLRKKIAEYQEEKRRNFNPFIPVRETYFGKKMKRGRRSQKDGKYRKLDMGCFTPPLQYPCGQLPPWPKPLPTCLFLPIYQPLPIHQSLPTCQPAPTHQTFQMYPPYPSS